jgi:hypothetical protein
MPDIVMIPPINDEMTTAMPTTNNASTTQVAKSWPSIHLAARQLVNTIIDPTERSIPP